MLRFSTGPRAAHAWHAFVPWSITARSGLQGPWRIPNPSKRRPADPQDEIRMSDTKNTGDKTLHVQPTKTLTLKRPVEQGVVRQSFSHGRSKAVVVEKVKRRVIG